MQRQPHAPRESRLRFRRPHQTRRQRRRDRSASDVRASP